MKTIRTMFGLVAIAAPLALLGACSDGDKDNAPPAGDSAAPATPPAQSSAPAESSPPASAPDSGSDSSL